MNDNHFLGIPIKQIGNATINRASELRKYRSQNMNHIGLGYNPSLKNVMFFEEGNHFLTDPTGASISSKDPNAVQMQKAITSLSVKTDFDWNKVNVKKFEAMVVAQNKGAISLDYQGLIDYYKSLAHPVDLDLIYAIGIIECNWGKPNSNSAGYKNKNIGNITGSHRFAIGNGPPPHRFLIFSDYTSGAKAIADFLNVGGYPRSLKELFAKGGMIGKRGHYYCEGTTGQDPYTGKIALYAGNFRRAMGMK